jgi:predicted  nucleic acid-binding Zn-ribbon protein
LFLPGDFANIKTKMPHQCVKCSRIIPMASRELLEGCNDCGSHFFFYIREDQLAKIKAEPVIEIPEAQKEKIEKDIRQMAGIVEPNAPVILDIESVRTVGEGKFEIDIVNLFRKDRPLIYKLEEGKYIIDLASTLKKNISGLKEIVNPNKKDSKENSN